MGSRSAGGVLFVAFVLAGCGRFGFDVTETSAKPDGSAVASMDSPLGFGSYQVASASTPYISPLGAQLAPGFVDGADEDTFGFALPFTFTYFGIPYDVVTASTNGWVTFAPPPSGDESFVNDCPFDGSGPDALIAVFWDDLFASAKTSPKGSIAFATDGVAPDRTFTIEWRDLDGWYQQGNSFYGQRMRVTQKIVLHETGVIDLHYGSRTPPIFDKDCGLDRHRGCSATIGLRAPGNASTTTVQCGTDGGRSSGFIPIDEGRLFTFTPQG